MTIKSAGSSLKMSEIDAEFDQGTMPWKLSEMGVDIGIAAGNRIGISNFYGKYARLNFLLYTEGNGEKGEAFGWQYYWSGQNGAVSPDPLVFNGATVDSIYWHETFDFLVVVFDGNVPIDTFERFNISGYSFDVDDASYGYNTTNMGSHTNFHPNKTHFVWEGDWDSIFYFTNEWVNCYLE